MISESNCQIRNCNHYIGVNDKMSEHHICEAYPVKIPDEIASGDDLHIEFRGDELVKVKFEKRTKTAIPDMEIIDGEIVLNFDASQDCSDWMALGRLRKKAKEGDQEAIEELNKREQNLRNCRY